MLQHDLLSIPSVISACAELGVEGKHLIGMQGPFSTEINEAMLRQYQCSYLVTKDTGLAGGFPEKMEACRRLGVIPVIIGRPLKEEGLSLLEARGFLAEFFGVSLSQKISLVGIGMGNGKLLTGEAGEAIAQAEAVCGAKRLLAAADTLIAPDAEKREAYLPADLLPYIYSCRERKIGRIAILFSGDTGFYSGAEAVYKALQEEVRLGK